MPPKTRTCYNTNRPKNDGVRHRHQSGSLNENLLREAYVKKGGFVEVRGGEDRPIKTEKLLKTNTFDGICIFQRTSFWHASKTELIIFSEYSNSFEGVCRVRCAPKIANLLVGSFNFWDGGPQNVGAL